jgi:RNA polymerase sigma factor (sigma-70 family)
MESFERLLSQYEPMIYSIIKILHIYKNKEEFYQIGITALWEASLAYDVEKGGFTSFAYPYIKGRMLTELKKDKKQEDRFLMPQEEYWEAIEDSSISGPCELEMLLANCGGLTEKQKKWVLYTFSDDLSVREIADREQVSPSAVKQWRKGALAGVKKYLSAASDGH